MHGCLAGNRCNRWLLARCSNAVEAELDRANQLEWFERFADVVGHPRSQTPLLLTFERVGRERDDRDGKCILHHESLALPNLTSRGKPVHFRHLAVHQNQVVMRAANRIDGLTSVADGVALVAGMGQDLESNLLVNLVVFRQQDAGSLVRGAGNGIDLRNVLSAHALPRPLRGIAGDHDLQGVEQRGLHDRLGDAFGKPELAEPLQILNDPERRQQNQSHLAEFRARIDRGGKVFLADVGDARPPRSQPNKADSRPPPRGGASVLRRRQQPPSPRGPNPPIGPGQSSGSRRKHRRARREDRGFPQAWKWTAASVSGTCNGMVNQKVDPLPAAALETDLAPHQFAKLLANDEAQARASIFSRGRRINLRKRVEEAIETTLRNADAAVLNHDFQHGRLIQRQRTDDDASAFRELDGIVHEIGNDLPQPARIPDQPLRQRLDRRSRPFRGTSHDSGEP